MVWRLYKITNRLNGKSYIGYTKNTLEWRWTAHCAGSYRNSIIHRAIRKYGKTEFSIEELFQVSTKQEAKARERDLIASHGTFMPGGYNMTLGGDGNDAPRSEQTRERMRQARARLKHLGFTLSPEARTRISAANKGRKRPQSATESQRAKMIGQKRSDAMRAKMREIGLNRTYSPETRARMRAGQLGKKRPRDVVEKTASKLRGRRRSAETVAKIWIVRRERIRKIIEHDGQLTLDF